MNMKMCRTCGENLPLDLYYRHPLMADGHLNICRECTKTRVRAHRAKNIDAIRAYDRNRPNHDERMAENRRRYKEAAKDPAARKHMWGRAKVWADSNPEKRAAHAQVSNATRAGKITPQPCEKCGHALNVQAHHEDYSKPLDVVWLCGICHGKRHREINEARRKAIA
jgi:hypothetical protein